MGSVKNKVKKKRIKTTLTIKLMEGKILRDMYRELLKDKVPSGFDEKEVMTTISLDDEYIPYTAYKKFSGYGASREFLEMFKVIYSRNYKVIDSSSITNAIYKIVPFTTISGISSVIISYSVGSNRLDYSGDINFEIETYSYKENITEDQIKSINKENARKLRYVFVSLSSVQGVPYSCTYKEVEDIERECSI